MSNRSDIWMRQARLGLHAAAAEPVHICMYVFKTRHNCSLTFRFDIRELFTWILRFSTRVCGRTYNQATRPSKTHRASRYVHPVNEIIIDDTRGILLRSARFMPRHAAHASCCFCALAFLSTMVNFSSSLTILWCVFKETSRRCVVLLSDICQVFRFSRR